MIGVKLQGNTIPKRWKEISSSYGQATLDSIPSNYDAHTQYVVSKVMAFNICLFMQLKMVFN